MFEALALQLPEVMKNIKTFIALGPVASIKNMTSPLFNELKKMPYLPKSLILAGIYEFMPRMRFVSEDLAYVCRILT